MRRKGRGNPGHHVTAGLHSPDSGLNLCHRKTGGDQPCLAGTPGPSALRLQRKTEGAHYFGTGSTTCSGDNWGKHHQNSPGWDVRWVAIRAPLHSSVCPSSIHPLTCHGQFIHPSPSTCLPTIHPQFSSVQTNGGAHDSSMVPVPTLCTKPCTPIANRAPLSLLLPYMTSLSLHCWASQCSLTWLRAYVLAMPLPGTFSPHTPMALSSFPKVSLHIYTVPLLAAPTNPSPLTSTAPSINGRGSLSFVHCKVPGAEIAPTSQLTAPAPTASLDWPLTLWDTHAKQRPASYMASTKARLSAQQSRCSAQECLVSAMII